MSDREETVQYAKDRPECLDSLTDREQRIVRSRWMGLELRRPTLRELGEEFGVTGSRIREIEHDALVKIRRFKRLDERRCPQCQGRGWI